MNPKRAVCFIDGFNLYHSLNNRNSFRKYKWLDLWKICQKFLTLDEELIDVLYFTAYADWNPEKQSRHHTYVTINQNQGCRVILGNFQEITRTSRVKCHRPCFSGAHQLFCNKTYLAHEEKKTDVNIAVSILKTCVQGVCDAVYLLSGDNDLVPALETARELCPDMRIRVLLQINAQAKKLMAICRKNDFKYMRINEEHLAESQFPDSVIIGDKTYDRPPTWS
jgi:uncharacterized LabA/DUF88 family protein